LTRGGARRDEPERGKGAGAARWYHRRRSQGSMEDSLVIVVDDDASVRKAIVRLLTSVGHRTAAYDSPAALLASEPPTVTACLVLDLQMPGMDGFELLERLREAGRELPAVFVTGSGDARSTAHAWRRGAVDVLHKPFTDDQLLHAVDVALERARAGAAGDEPGD
jgi:FixJ family two-component response regulator